MLLSLIAAMSANRVIGRENRIPWHLPADLRYFKKLTMGHHLILGRLTYESIGRPLPGRTLVVLTRREDYGAGDLLIASTLEQALHLCGDDSEPFVGGGAGVYEEALEHARRIYLTLIHQEFEGDRFFPRFEQGPWNLTHREDHSPDERNPHAYSFLLYDRV